MATSCASMASLFFFQLLLLVLFGSNTASSTTAAAVSSRIQNQQTIHNNNNNNNGAEKDRRLAVYALYNLDKVSVRFLTVKTDELEQARASATQTKGGDNSMGDQWILVSETGGLESSLSYPIRTVTERFLYIGFQNLIDDWLLELSGGPDGNNDLSYRNVTQNKGETRNDGDFGGRFLQALVARAQQENPAAAGQVYNIDGGDSTGEQDYNTIGSSSSNSAFDSVDATGTEIEVEPETETPTAETISSATSNQNQQQTAQIPTDIDVESSTSQVQQPESAQMQTESTPVTQIPPENESSTTNNIAASDPAVLLQTQPSSYYVNIYDGLVYNSIYEHLVTVDLHVKLYFRKDGVSGDLDSLRRNLRTLQTDNIGEVELLAEIFPTIAFSEPVSEAKKLNKPTNSDVKELFGGWMEYMFTRQRGVYLSTLKEYEDQSLLQEISTLKVDVSASGSPYLSAASSSSKPTGAWSESTQKALVSTLIVLGIIALIWPMFIYGKHIKKHREISLQLMNSEGADGDYDFSDSFGSVAYRDVSPTRLKLPPIHPTIDGPDDFSLPRPRVVGDDHRASSLDAAHHGKDIFPSKDRDMSQKSALSALEKSDRYLSRHRPDLFYDQEHSPNSKGRLNVFGRSYEIPSNPFDFIAKGWDQQPQQQQQIHRQASNTGSDLGRNAHFPFASPRSSFTARPSSIGSNPYAGRATSVGSTGSASNANHFTPIAKPKNQNLAAGFSDEDEENGAWAFPGIAAHTGHSWQNNNDMQQQQVRPSDSEGGSVISNIFRNLSVSSWYNGSSSINNSYTANSQIDPQFHPNPSRETEEIYYDDYHHQHQDQSLFQNEIELESLPHDEESPENYDFAFQDFPRKDGTPCLIIDDDSFLSERKRRESAKMIFNIDDEANLSGSRDDGSLTEKKLDDVPVSDDAFKMMLSQNAMDIDNSVIHLDGSQNSMVLPPLEGSFLSKDPHDVKSPEFQNKLSRLMDTKQQRYTRENKNAAIVAANRKKRKNVRERERVDRHKAIERELEDIEAEFSLTMQPLSPKRDKDSSSKNNPHGPLTPKRNAHSPKPPTAGNRYSPMPSRMADSPARKNSSKLSPTRSNLKSIAANSPARSSMGRSRGIGGNNSSSSHRKQSSLGNSPFRTINPRTRKPSHSHSRSIGGNNDIFRAPSVEGVSQSASQKSASHLDSMSDMDGDFKPTFRPTNAHGVGLGSNYDDLSLPSIGGEKTLFRSPQAVIDEVMQSGAQNGMQKPRPLYQRSGSHRQRSLTPSKMSLSKPRRTNSFDVSDDSYQRRVNPSGSSNQRSMIGLSSSIKSGGNSSSHRRARSGSIGSNHNRSSSREGDIFLHGVVAQTRFI